MPFVNSSMSLFFLQVADNVYDMFKTQYTLYSQAYMHKIVKINEKK